MTPTRPLLLLSLAFGLFALQADAQQVERSVDATRSAVKWTGSKVAGKHEGFVSVRSGTLVMDGDELLMADIVMDMASITCTDLTNEKSNAKLVGHLKSTDFFGVEEFPLASFRTTRVERLKGVAEATHRITGQLTIKGTTHASTFDVNLMPGRDGLKATGTIRFDRTKYDIRYGSGSFFDGLGDRMIHDEVVLDFELHAR